MDKIGNKKSIDIVTDVTITNALAIAFLLSSYRSKVIN
jgi:hypothetical protein